MLVSSYWVVNDLLTLATGCIKFLFLSITMRSGSTYLFIAVSSIALIAILVIQVNWILNTAKIKEEIFNEKANMVLSRTIEALESNEVACRNIEESVGRNTSNDAIANLRKEETRTIDSLFNHYMRFYNFRIDYTFEVTKNTSFAGNYGSGFTGNSFNKPLNENELSNGVQIKLIFPEKKQFIIAEMGSMFVTSILLIVVVMILFWRTVLSLMKEKRLSEHTTEYLNNMTHEFKTPLTNISLAGKMLSKDPAILNSEKTKNYTSIILEENEKLIYQVEQVLSMTALERDEIPFKKENLDLHQIIRQALKLISIQIENKNGELNLLLHANHATVSGDKTHLKNAISNLIDNAIKYSSSKPEITIKTYNRDTNLIVEVTDKGIGIDKEYQQLIFEKFFRVPTGDVHDVKGFGLGLAYVKKIIEFHGGALTLVSERGNGSTFIIQLPNA